MSGETLAFTKGHGTENDFVLLFDELGGLDLTPALVRALCDRKAGIGADGVLRAVRAGSLPDGKGFASDTWFMDYRNADGTIAEMCGNGARVFAAFLEREAGEDVAAGLTIATRAGAKVVTALGGGLYAVGMGRFAIPGGGTADSIVTIAGLTGDRPGVAVSVGNPHVVVALAMAGELAAADLGRPPVVSPAPPEGANVELVVPDTAEASPHGHVRMRVHERGVGETRSCGTGACAVAVAARAWAGVSAPTEWEVEVQGGSLIVRIEGDEVTLEGPAVLVADGLVDLSSLTRA